MTTAEEVQTFVGLITPSVGTVSRGFFPDKPDVGGCIYAYGGRMPERKFGFAGTGYEFPTLQIVFRGLPYDFDTPWNTAHTVMNAFMAVTPGALCSGVSTVYLMIRPLQSPFTIKPVDEQKRHYIGFNFQLDIEP